MPAGKAAAITQWMKSTLDGNGCQTIFGGVDQYRFFQFSLCRALQHSPHSDDLSGAGCWHFAQIPNWRPFMWVLRVRGIKVWGALHSPWTPRDPYASVCTLGTWIPWSLNLYY